MFLSLLIVGCSTSYRVNIKMLPYEDADIYLNGKYIDKVIADSTVTIETGKVSIHANPLIEVITENDTCFLLLNSIAEFKDYKKNEYFGKKVRKNVMELGINKKDYNEPIIYDVVFSNSEEMIDNIVSMEKYTSVLTIKASTDWAVQEMNVFSFSPSYNIVSVGGRFYDGSNKYKSNIKLFDSNTGKLLHILEGHSDRISSMTLSPNSKILATGSWDKTIRLWRIKDGSLIRKIGWDYLIESITFSHDGKMIAGGCAGVTSSFDETQYGGTIRLWNIKTGEVLCTFKRHKNNVLTLSFSPDDKMIASGSKDNTIKIWNLDDCSLARTINNGCDVYSIAFSPDGNIIASGGSDGKIKLWNSYDGELIKTLSGHDGKVYSLDFSSDVLHLISGGRDKTIKIWRIIDGGLTSYLKGHNDDVLFVTFGKNESLICSGSKDKTIRIWKSNDILTFEEMKDKILNEKTVELRKISKLVELKNEFETESEYQNRLKAIEIEKSETREKYRRKLIGLDKEYQRKEHEKMQYRNMEIQFKIKESISETQLRIDNIGKYNAEKEVLPITINNITKDINIPRSEARSFKENLQKTKVVGLKQLTKNLVTYEFFNINIIHPITSSRYPFGEHRALDGVSSGQYVYITATLDNIRNKPNGTIVKKCRKGETYPYLGKENDWFKLKLDNGIVAYTHQTNGELILEATQRIAVLPPELKISAKLKEPSGNGFLDAEETGKIVIDIKNKGKGSAYGLIIDLQGEINDPNISYSRTRVAGEIEPGLTKSVEFTIEANKKVKRKFQSFIISATESNGFDPEPVKISFETYPLQLPDLSLVDFGIKTASGDNIIIPGEVVDIKARVQNIGEGKAKDIKFSVNPPANVFFAPGSKQKFNFSEFDIGDFVDFEFSILTNKKVQDEVIISIGATEKYTQKSFSLLLEINKPLQSVQEFVVKGKEREKVKIQNVATLTIEIAKDIPRTNTDKKDAYAVVIANRDYLKVQNVDYSINDATLMKEYLIKSLGYRDENIFFIKNATKADFELYFGTKGAHKGRLYNSVRPDGQSEVFIYYSGHGSPDIETGKGYFVPVDADPMYVSLSGFPTDLLYENLAKVPTKNVTVVLDACFSGSGLLKNISPVRIKFDNTVAKIKNCVVFSSSTGDQVSSWYPKKQQGMFTYFFLKGIHNKNADSNKDGKITYSELFQFVTDRNEGVPRYARQLHNVDQMPTFWGDKEKVFVEY